MSGASPTRAMKKNHLAVDFFHGEPSMGAYLRVQVLLRAGHSEQREGQLREGDRAV